MMFMIMKFIMIKFILFNAIRKLIKYLSNNVYIIIKFFKLKYV